jgi:hypothetical protein
LTATVLCVNYPLSSYQVEEVLDFFGKCRLKRILGRLGLKPSWEGLTKLFYLARDF